MPEATCSQLQLPVWLGVVPQRPFAVVNSLLPELANGTYDIVSVAVASCSRASRWPTSCAIVAHSSSFGFAMPTWFVEKLNAMPRSVTPQKLSAEATPRMPELALQP